MCFYIPISFLDENTWSLQGNVLFLQKRTKNNPFTMYKLSEIRKFDITYEEYDRDDLDSGMDYQACSYFTRRYKLGEEFDDEELEPLTDIDDEEELFIMITDLVINDGHLAGELRSLVITDDNGKTLGEDYEYN